MCRAANCWLAWKQKSLWINAMCLACVDICYLMDHHICAARCHCALVVILSVSFSQWERETWLRLEKYRPAFLASGKTQTWALSVSNSPVLLHFRDCRWDSQAQIKTLTVIFGYGDNTKPHADWISRQGRATATFSSVATTKGLLYNKTWLVTVQLEQSQSSLCQHQQEAFTYL